eukprot:m.266899 g.266899  ORF g.266899 m.266899 type:complete len:87 (+) comp54707_c0_seq21:1266-1526(+)
MSRFTPSFLLFALQAEQPVINLLEMAAATETDKSGPLQDEQLAEPQSSSAVGKVHTEATKCAVVPAVVSVFPLALDQLDFNIPPDP